MIVKTILFFSTLLLAVEGRDALSKTPFFLEEEIPKKESIVGLLKIEGEIKPVTYVYVKKALEEFHAKNVDSIILHLNTPGGEVFSAVRIAEAIKGSFIPVECYIDNWAISAGALLAYSCPKIYVSKTAIMGAAEPVESGGEGMVTAKEKVNSAVRAQFAAVASLYGRNPFLAEAMVDKDLLLVERNGVLVTIPEHETIKHQDRIVSPKGKLLTLTATELLDFGIAKQSIATLEELTHPFDKVIEYENVRVGFFSFLAHPLISTLLTVGFLLGVFLEISQPGMVVPGIIALLCLGLNLLAQHSLDLFTIFEVVFLLVGIVLLLFEFLVYSTHGVLAFFGLIFVLIGGVLLVVPEISHREIPSPILFFTFCEKGVWALGILLFILSGGFMISRRILQFLFEKSPFVLRTEKMQRKEICVLVSPKIGALAEAITPLRPSGKIAVSGTLYNALSEGEYIPSGTKLRVVRVEGGTVLIKRL